MPPSRNTVILCRWRGTASLGAHAMKDFRGSHRWALRGICGGLAITALAALGATPMTGVAAAASGAAAPQDHPAATAASPTAASPWRESVRTLAQQKFRQPAWGYSHCVRDYQLARELAATDHVALDDDVLYAAAFLHDMAAFPPWKKEGVDHADRAAEQVAAVLAGTGFPMQKIDAVRAAIRTHMYDREPVGPEALYLHDADALDWLGAVGVARILALVDPNGGKPTAPEVIPMLKSNLQAVPARVLSPAGRARMPQRRDQLARFLQELSEQTDNLGTL
ncbi:MAG: HD domain-containing protein [Proteobacteria bacterium]|nr:HD domain-containing protein [Pseudomonadota bacterium]